MLTKSQIAIGVLAVVAIHDTMVNVKNKKRFNEILEENTTLKSLVNQNAFVARYLVEIINANEIALDEFDMIALNNPM